MPMDPRLLIGVAGMPGSGKSLLVLAAKKMGVPVISMGDVVRKEALKRGLPVNRATLSALATELRAKEGPDAIAKRCLQELRKCRSNVVLIDGLRSIFEYDTFKNHYPLMKVVFVFASPGTRFRRLRARGREDDPQNWDEFVERDLRELRFGLSALFYISDVVFINEGKTFNEALKDASLILRRLVKNAHPSSR